jgi:MutS-like protein
VIDPRADYERRLEHWRGRIAAHERSHLWISNGRLAVAALGALIVWTVFVRGTAAAAWLLLPLGAFLALVVVHARVLQRLERARRAADWYARGLDRLEGRWAGRGRNGARFLDDHPYARDLDLFGRGSLFELLNAANTEAGEETLATWLRDGAAIDVVRSRQLAVDELRANGAFREDLAILAAETEVSRTGSMASWAQAEPAGLTGAAAATFAACAAITVAIAVLVFTERIGGRWLILWLVAEGGIAMIWRTRVHLVLRRIASPDRDLALMTDLLARIEAETFTTPRLTAISAALLSEGMPPSRRVAQLRRLVSWLDSSRNQLFAPIALALLLPQQLAAAIDRWHGRFRDNLMAWLGAVGELEALSSLATHAFEHPADPFPELVESGALFAGEGLAHPLMSEAAAVRNDVLVVAPGFSPADESPVAQRFSPANRALPQVLVISGSNMSGKSTLLRSVGVNVVLALAGAPVRAAQLTLSPLVIGATLRVEDSLQAGHSRFYAEILRIRAIVDRGRGPVPLLFLLDEILHGTNSYDRRIGAEAIVRALVNLRAIGLVTTHDLALTELPDKLGAAAANMHFEDRLEAGRMVFDYRMRPGVVEHSNALALMRAVGLDV